MRGYRKWCVSIVSSVVFLIFLNCGVAWGQTSSGSISGTVKDSTGGAIPAAPVSVTNTVTGVVQKTQTTVRGFSRSPAWQSASTRSMSLQPGFALTSGRV